MVAGESGYKYAYYGSFAATTADPDAPAADAVVPSQHAPLPDGKCRVRAGWLAITMAVAALVAFSSAAFSSNRRPTAVFDAEVQPRTAIDPLVAAAGQAPGRQAKQHWPEHRPTDALRPRTALPCTGGGCETVQATNQTHVVTLHPSVSQTLEAAKELLEIGAAAVVLLVKDPSEFGSPRVLCLVGGISALILGLICRCACGRRACCCGRCGGGSGGGAPSPSAAKRQRGYMPPVFRQLRPAGASADVLHVGANGELLLSDPSWKWATSPWDGDAAKTQPHASVSQALSVKQQEMLRLRLKQDRDQGGPILRLAWVVLPYLLYALALSAAVTVGWALATVAMAPHIQ